MWSSDKNPPMIEPTKRAKLRVAPADGDARAGIQSVEIGLRLVTSLADASTKLRLGELAARAGMHRSKAHRYLVSLGRSGLVRQDENGLYAFGPLALRIGLAALNDLNPVSMARAHLDRLASELHHTIAVAVWGDRGPIYIESRDPPLPIRLIFNIRVGTFMPLTHSAAGLLFAAYVPREQTQPLIELELRQNAGKKNGSAGSLRALEQKLAAVTKYGLARVRGDFQSGIDALSAPIVDRYGHIVLALSAMGHSSEFDGSYDGPVARGLLAAAATMSEELGFRAHGAEAISRRHVPSGKAL
jgi:DNA-binding IclR family transcriptional regulator